MKSWVVFFVLFLPALAGAKVTSHDVVLDEAFEGKWVRQYLALAAQSKNMRELFQNLGTVQTQDALQLEKNFDLNRPVPRLTYQDDTITFDGKTTLKIISLQTYDFRINGHHFRYDPDLSAIDNLHRMEEALHRKESVKFLWPLGLLNQLVAAPAKKAADDEEDEDSDDDDDKTDLFFNDYEKYMMDPTKVSDDSTVGWFLIGPLSLGDFLVSKGESFLSKSCTKQVDELNSLLEENHLGIKTLNCGSDYRGTDRTITYWTPGRPPQKKTFNLDYRAGTLREEDSNRMMFFDYDSLHEVREIKYDKSGHPYRVDYHKNSPEFEETKKSIEPFRRILFYMGVNRSCDKCAKELKEKVASHTPPAYLTPAAPAKSVKPTRRRHSSGQR